MTFLEECYKEEERLALKIKTVRKLINHYMENKEFADSETAKTLKELGFDEECFAFYNYRTYINPFRVDSDRMCKNSENQKGVFSFNACPLWQQVEQWLWEKKKIVVRIEQLGNHWLWIRIEPKTIPLCCLDKYDSPITAKIEGIKQAIKHLHSKK